MEPSLEDVLEKAAQLQELVPGAVLVGGSAAALYAHHRQSFDHDHVVADLAERFDAILENLEALGDWSMTRAQPGKIILGELGGIETGVRQLLRSRPLETTDMEVRGKQLVVPTRGGDPADQGVACTQPQPDARLPRHSGPRGSDRAGRSCRRAGDIDDYYADINRQPETVSTQLVRQLADPRPRDAEVTTQLASYKALDPRWHDWSTVKAVLATSRRGSCDDAAISQPRLRYRSADGQWPAEAIETVIDRGSLSDWRRLAKAIRHNPWGPAARTTETIVGWGEHYGVDALMTNVIRHAREDINAARAGRVRRTDPLLARPEQG